MDEYKEVRSAGITDEQIVELYWNRSETAIQATEAKYGRKLFGIAWNILYDKLDCEECLNDTYFRIWNRIPPTRPVVFVAFITKIVRGIAIDKYKIKSSKKRIPSELTVSLEELCNILYNNSLENQYDEKVLSGLISDYIRTLSDRSHYIFIGRFYFGGTIEQIAKELGISKATVCREIIKLKEDLKQYLERNGVFL